MRNSITCRLTLLACLALAGTASASPMPPAQSKGFHKQVHGSGPTQQITTTVKFKANDDVVRDRVVREMVAYGSGRSLSVKVADRNWLTGNTTVTFHGSYLRAPSPGDIADILYGPAGRDLVRR